jgi:hypothetical protein
MRSSPAVTSLNAGEFSPALEGRSDLAKYPSACKLLQNFQLLVQGPAQRRGGSRYVAPIKDESGGAWLIRFEFSATQAFVLEFGDEYVRFYFDHGRVLVSGVPEYDNGTDYVIGDLVMVAGVDGGFDSDAFDEGAFDPDSYEFTSGSGDVFYYCIADTTGNAPPDATYWYALTDDIYEIPSPYALADMFNDDGSCALQFVQSGDVLYIAHQDRAHKPQMLTRYGSTDWVFAEYRPNQGPFLPENDTATTIIASAVTGGAITLTASAALFAATDVGRLVRLQSQEISSFPWEAAAAYADGDVTHFQGKYYKAIGADTSKTSPPIHEQGDEYDGKNGVLWRYKHSGYGIARIVGYTSPTIVTAEVIADAINGLNELPEDVVSDQTARWKLGAWSDTTGYPSAVTFFKNRLHWGGGLDWWASVPNDFKNMSADFFGQITADAAITEQVNSQDVNAILWMEGLDKLVIGTGGGEFVIGPQANNAAYGPGNISSDKQSKKRSRAVQPVVVGTSLCYVQRAGRKLQSCNYVIERDRFVSTDLAVLAERMTRTGIIATAYQGEPHSIIWCVLGNGKLIGFTYNQEQQVEGWHRHQLGGTDVVVESIATIPAPDGDREELWLIVKRTINGETHRYVEFLEKPWEGPDQDDTEGDDQEDAFYVDSGLTYDGASTSTISGLDHLEGETVQILADGAVQPDKVVTSGAITLSRAASKVQVGLQSIARCIPLKIEAGASDGTAQGKLQRVVGLAIRFIDTLGGKAGMKDSRLDPLSLRNPNTPMGQGSPITSGIFVCDFPGDWDRNGQIEIRQDQPLPMTVSALYPVINTSPT